MERKNNYSKYWEKHTYESNEKNRQAHLGKKLSDEIIEKRKFSEQKKIRQLLYKKTFGGHFRIENISINYVHKNKSKSFNFNTNGYVKSIQMAFDLKFSKNDYFNNIKEFQSNYNKIHNNTNKCNKIYKNTNGYIIVSSERVRYKYSENGKENGKSFYISKYGYVIAMKNCLDFMFKKNNYFNERIKKLNQKNYFLT